MTLVKERAFPLMLRISDTYMKEHLTDCIGLYFMF